jgi:hypothetical protein
MPMLLSICLIGSVQARLTQAAEEFNAGAKKEGPDIG